MKFPDARGKVLMFPCFVDAKVDGVGAIYFKGSLMSKDGKVIKPTLKTAAIMMGANGFDQQYPYFGELFVREGHLNDLYPLLAALKGSREDKILFSIFDVGIPNCALLDRREFLSRQQPQSAVPLTPTKYCTNHTEAEEAYHYFINNGYEGVMNKYAFGFFPASVGWVKRKYVDTVDLKVFGIEKAKEIIVARDKLKNCIRVKCSLPYDERLKLIGKIVEVKHIGKIKTNGLTRLRNPTLVRVRNDKKEEDIL